jgi:hypothetical protein
MKLDDKFDSDDTRFLKVVTAIIIVTFLCISILI